MMYEQLCTEFYNADKKFASGDELKLYQELFSKEDILFEPMCGSGRLLIPLMQLGYAVHGIDCSSAMLNSCKLRANALNLYPILFEDDILDFKTTQKYNGIVIPFGSFQLFYPRKNAYQALEKFYDLLLPNGKLVLDLFVPWDAMHEHGAIDESKNQVILPSGEIIEIHSHTTSDRFSQHMHSKNKYTKYFNKKLVAEEFEEMDILWYYKFEMELILEKYGFKNIKHIDRFLNQSQHMTFIANK